MNRADQFVEDARNESVHIKDRKGRNLIIAAIAAALLFLAASVSGAAILYKSTLDSAQQGQSLAQQVQAACADTSRDTKDLGDLCKKAEEVVDDAPQAVAGDPGPKGDQGDAGATGDAGPGPTADQVASAVSLYCSTGRCTKGPTQSQVIAAVATYCTANGECRGPTGVDGKAGTDGAAGQPGADGPPPSAESIANAVINYCDSHDGCRGPQGNAATADGVVTGGTCNLAFLGLGDPVPSGTVVGSITLTVTRDGVETEITIPCNNEEG